MVKIGSQSVPGKEPITFQVSNMGAEGLGKVVYIYWWMGYAESIGKVKKIC